MATRTDISRRTFLGSAGLAVAAPYFVPASALARLGQPGSGANDRIKLGMIGMGKRGFELLGPFLDRGDIQVVGVCDVDTTRRDHAKGLVNQRYGNAACKAFIDHRELLEKAGVDAVFIGTPDHWHVNQVVEAAAAKKDIYCEKPLTLNLAEGKAMIDACRKHAVVLQTGSQQRTEYEGRFVKACEYVRSGRIGRVLAVHVGIGVSSKACDLPEESMEEGLDWDRWLGPAPKRPYNSVLSPRGVHDHYPNWRLYWEYSGGMMTDWGAHHFDIAQWGLGMDESGPVEVHPPRDAKAEHGARLVYASGVTVYHGGPPGVTFVGENGSIYVDRGRLESNPKKILEEPLTDKDVKLPRTKSHIDNWVECIRSRAKPICDVEVGARSIALSHLCNLAYWHRRSLKWDPAAWTFPDDAEAQGWMDSARRDGFGMPKV